MDLKKYIYDVKDFPKKGIIFKDITPILNNSKVYKKIIDMFVKIVNKYKFDVIVAPEARGFIFASTIAYLTNKRFVLARKPNKLPREYYSEKYDFEYSSSQLQIHKSDIKPIDKVLIIDDVLATGETILAICNLIKKFNAKVVGIVVLLELINLNGKEKINMYNYNVLLK